MIRLMARAVIVTDTAARNAVLSSAAECFVRLGISQTTAADIARGAGISRATLYRRYGGTVEIFHAVLARESEQMSADAADLLASVTDPSLRLVEGMVFAIQEVQRRPVHAALFSTGDADWSARRAIRATSLRRISEDAIRPLIDVTGTGLAEPELGDLVDWILRLIISYATVPGPGDLDEATIRRQLNRLLVPAVTALLGRATPEEI
jgi:AcrR family transcriptional regulator